jgi:calcineurin-like phosphoesterase family protein
MSPSTSSPPQGWPWQLYRLLKGSQVTLFFVADMHFGSPFRSYAKPRGFATTGAMNAAIAEAWRSRVTEEDTVWILGDVGDLDSLAPLPGTKHLVFGNDDTPRAAFRDSGLFASHAMSHVLETGWGSILLIHIPKAAKQSDLPVLHGHTHAAPEEPDVRFVSVSVDKTGWGPISLEEVVERFKARAAGC